MSRYGLKPVTTHLSTLVSGHRTVRHLPLLLFLSGLLAYGASFAWYVLHRFDLVNVIITYQDDAFYYFQIAKNFAEGRFSTFDGGITRTNGYHPLWMVLITPLWWVFDPDDALFAVKVFEIMLVAGAVALVVVAVRLAHLPWILLFAALPVLYRTEGLLLGLEAAAGLFMLGLLFLAMGLYAREPGRWRWLLAAVAFLQPWVRLEYAAISVAATGALCLIEWSWRDGGLGRVPGGAVRSMSSLAAFTPLLGACAGVLVYFAWNGIVFGGIVPVSGAAKQLYSQQWLEREGGYDFVRNFQEVAGSGFFDWELLVALEVCVYFVLAWWCGRRSRRTEDRLFLVFLAGMFALSAGHVAKFVQSVLTMHPYLVEHNPWHYVPAYLMMALVVPVRCYVAVYFICRLVGWNRPRIASVLSKCILVPAALFMLEATNFSWPHQYIEDIVKSRGLAWVTPEYAGTLVLNRILPEGSIIGSWDSGTIGYFSRFPVVNLDGLVNSYEYLQEARDKELAWNRQGDGFRNNAEFYRRNFGITHFANRVDYFADHENVYFETTPSFNATDPHYEHRPYYAFRLWSEEPPRTPQNEIFPASWFWKRVKPHLDIETDGAGVVIDGRLIQAFTRECVDGQDESSIILLLDREDWIIGVLNPWENVWTTSRGRRPGSCTDTILLPRDADASRPIRMEMVSEGDDVSRLLGDDRPVVRSGYDVYLHKKQLIYVNRQCDGDADTSPLFFVHVTPVDDSDLPVGYRQHGIGYFDFAFDDLGRRTGNTCIAVQHLPGYGITRVRTGQHVAGKLLWEGEIRFDIDAQWISGVIESMQPVIRSDFDVYHAGNRLLYTGEGCSDEDLAHPFFVHVVPADEDDLPEPFRQHGVDFLDFQFETRRLPLDFHFKHVPAPGGVKCIAEVDLPGYPIAAIRTGQHVAGKWLWMGEFEAGR